MNGVNVGICCALETPTKEETGRGMLANGPGKNAGRSNEETSARLLRGGFGNELEDLAGDNKDEHGGRDGGSEDVDGR